MKLQGTYNYPYVYEIECESIQNTWRVCQIQVHKSVIGNLAWHSFSLFGCNMTQLQTGKTSESMASLSLTERWMITEIRQQSISVLTYFVLTKCPSAIVTLLGYVWL